MSQSTPTIRPMGIGQLGNASVVFAHKFRYTLTGEHLPCDFVVSTKIDYKEHTLSFHYYDVKQDDDNAFHALKWAQAMEYKVYPNETLELSTYDGCGRELYKVKFCGLELLEHKSDFDYGTSEVSGQHIKLSFDKYTLDTFELKPSPTKCSKIIPPPNFQTEEVKISFLNCTRTIPGRPMNPVKPVKRKYNDECTCDE